MAHRLGAHKQVHTFMIYTAAVAIYF